MESKIKKEKPKVSEKANTGMLAWLTFQSLSVIVIAILSFLFVEVMSKYFYGSNGSGDNLILHALGLVIPMCTLLGAVNYYTSKMMYRHLTGLTNGLEKIANGNFNTTLEVKGINPLASAYENFNTMAAELKNVQTLRSDFINNYSHEFKTPITSINGFAQLLLEESVSEEDKKTYLQIIADESSRLANLANQTIFLSKLNTQQIVPHKTLYALDEQIRQCAIILSPEWGKKNINFNSELDSVSYNGSADIMQHLWLNLINNAIKYTPDGGDITLSLTSKDNKIIFSVCDSGIGMSEQVRAHIFEEYYQGDTAHSSKGLGLGLSIVKSIINLIGGEVAVKSEINCGSTFTVTLIN